MTGEQATIKINGVEYPLAFTMKQMEIQQEMMEQHPGNLGLLTSSVYGAIIVGARQAGIKNLVLDYDDVEIEVDRLVSSEGSEWKAIEKARDESYLYKKGREMVAENEKKSLMQTKSDDLPSDT